MADLAENGQAGLPVLYVEERVMRLALDPEHVNRMHEVEAQLARIRSGESTVEEEWGKALDMDEIRAVFDARFPNAPRRYPLPKHLHWMGESHG